jgi:hypothetical protein
VARGRGCSFIVLRSVGRTIVEVLAWQRGRVCGNRIRPYTGCSQKPRRSNC